MNWPVLKSKKSEDQRKLTIQLVEPREPVFKVQLVRQKAKKQQLLRKYPPRKDSYNARKSLLCASPDSWLCQWSWKRWRYQKVVLNPDEVYSYCKNNKLPEFWAYLSITGTKGRWELWASSAHNLIPVLKQQPEWSWRANKLLWLKKKIEINLLPKKVGAESSMVFCIISSWQDVIVWIWRVQWTRRKLEKKKALKITHTNVFAISSYHSLAESVE